MTLTQRQLDRAAGLCWICRRPCEEQGQRGPRQTHTECRVLHDTGHRVAEIRSSVARQGDGMTRMEKTRTETRNLPCTLTEEELRDRGWQLAKSVQDIATEETRQADQKAQMKATLAALEGQKTRLAIVVARREEWRDVLVDVYLDHGRGVVETVRQDTGETLSTRPMTDEERQMELPVGAEA